MDSPHPPWILREQAPPWVAAAITEEQWPESAVSHLLKRLLAEGVESVHLRSHPDGSSTVELAGGGGESPLGTPQALDATSARPFDEAIKRALAGIARTRPQ